MSAVEDLERVLAEYPKVHRGEPEIREPSGLSDDVLDRYQRDRLLSMVAVWLAGTLGLRVETVRTALSVCHL